METWLATSPLYGMILWIVLYISDYSLTIKSARGFREIGLFQFEGSFELTPQFQKDVDALKPISRRHVILLVLISLLIGLLWWLMQQIGFFPYSYLLLLGMFLLMEVPIHFRHLRNLFLIRTVSSEGGVEGQLSYRKWFSYKISAHDFYLFAAFFLVVAALSFSALFLGGALASLAVGRNHDKLSKKAKAAPAPVVEAVG